MNVQWIRLIDVFFIGPFLIYVALSISMPQWIRILLAGIGTATILYNGKTYLENR